MKKYLHCSVLAILMVVTFVGCKKDAYPPATIEESKASLPDYYRFIESLKKRGFKFWSFKKYWANRYAPLPDKLIVIRHDVHKRDLQYAYYAISIEKYLLNKSDVATYYVLYGDPSQKEDKDLQKKYIDLIHYCSNIEKFDVQPHLSINTFLIDKKYYPNYLYDKTADEINAIFNRNYVYNYTNNGIELMLTGEDSLNIVNIDDEILSILSDYDWPLGKFQSISSHGSHEEINLSYLNNQKLMDFKSLYSNDLFEFETYQTRIGNELTYLSDLAENSNPYWRINPDALPDGRYQLLMHPNVWSIDFIR